MATEINPDMIELIKNTDVTTLDLQELKVFISKAGVVYKPLEPLHTGGNGDRNMVLNQMWYAQKRIYHITYDPMWAEIREVIAKYGIVTEDDMEEFGLGLDHLGESCPPN